MRRQRIIISINSAGSSNWQWLRRVVLGFVLALCFVSSWTSAQSIGITDKIIRIGANMPLEGDNKANGLALKRGIEAALAHQLVQGRQIEFIAVNDFYDPTKSLIAAKLLIDQGIFLMLGGYGTPTTKAILPLLADNKVPAMGFYTGAAFTGPGDVLNFRTSYANEVESVVSAALTSGVKPTEVCAYVQNDAYGMAGVKGLRAALSKQPGVAPVIAQLDRILEMPEESPERNGIGPVGLYQRDTVNARDGYQSLKKWEQTSSNRCRLITLAAVYDPSATFIAYARYKGESWVFSTLSNVTGKKMEALLKEHKVTDRVIATEVVPALDSTLPVVADARKALGQDLDPVALEGYIIGKLFLAIALASDGPLTRENFLKAAHRQPYDIGGLKVDFTNGNQGSNFVLLMYLKNGAFTPVKPGDLDPLFR